MKDDSQSRRQDLQYINPTKDSFPSSLKPHKLGMKRQHKRQTREKTWTDTSEKISKWPIMYVQPLAAKEMQIKMCYYDPPTQKSETEKD